MDARPADPAAHSAPAAPPDHARLASIDLLRGLVIVLMVLDHVRDYVHAGRHANPLELTSTTPALFATRWITHFCAPVFVLLAGVSAWLQRADGKPVRVLARFLATRGLWLIVLELTVLTFAWQFWQPRLLFLQVMWAIGLSMLSLAALCALPPRVVLAVGVVIVAGHNALDSRLPSSFGPLAPLWTILHAGGTLARDPVRIRIAYPVLPWIGVMCLGFGLGPLFELDTASRRRWLTRLGVSLVVAFALLRSLDLYGDPGHWRVRASTWQTIGDFVDVQKYPPSLLYTLMTLGPALALLPWLERARGLVADVFLSFGRVPLFAYVVHIVLVHALAILLAWAMGVPPASNINALYAPTPASEAWGLSLPATYAFWLLVVALLAWPVRWFARLKEHRHDWWLGYL